MWEKPTIDRGSIASPNPSSGTHTQPHDVVGCLRRMEESIDYGFKLVEELRTRLEPVLAIHPEPELHLEKDPPALISCDSSLVVHMNKQEARLDDLLKDIDRISNRLQVH